MAGSKVGKLAGRVLIGGALIIVTAAAVGANHTVPLAVLVAVWSALATIEFCALLRLADIELNRWLLPMLNVLLVAAAWRGLLPGMLIAPVAVVLIWAVVVREPPRNPVYGTFALVYLGLLPAHLVMLRNTVVKAGLSNWVVLFPLALTWVSDTAAYAAGSIIGRHPLAPTISPRKTIEGAVAALVASGAMAGVWLHTLPPFSSHHPWWLAVVGVGLAAFGQMGDLLESTFKRAAGIKDSSTALGAHGGVLDRADSLLFTIPAFYYLVVSLL